MPKIKDISYISVILSNKPIEVKLDLELFIARRLLKGKESGSVSAIVRIAVAGIALGVCVMLLSVFIVIGFKQEITMKLSGFMSHLNISAYEHSEDYAGEGIIASDSLLRDIREINGVKQAYPYVSKPAILKSNTEIHGVILKGVDTLYDVTFYEKHLSGGEIPVLTTERASGDILISTSVAGLLNVRTGEKITAHFVQDPPRVRVFTVRGIYNTGFKEYDDMVVLCDIRHLQRLNSWEPDQVSGVGVELEDIEQIPEVEMTIDRILPLDENNNFYKVTTLRESAPQVFDWLNLLNTNVGIILTLIIVVAGFNMVSGLLILILDKTSLIGILKALGYKNLSLKKLFLYVAAGLILRGMIAGNFLALLLGGLQYYFRIVSLDPTTYYMDTVPVNFDIWYILLLNTGVLIVSVLMLIVPTMLISRIKPIKAIRFE